MASAESPKYFEKEPGLDYPGVVVSGAVIRDRKILLAQRGPNSTLGAGKWEFPGGKIDFGEHMTEALVRELKEELGIIVEPDENSLMVSEVIRSKNNGDSRNAHWISPMFECMLIEGEPKILEPDKCMGFRWSTLEEIREEELTAGGVEHLKNLRKRYPKGFPIALPQTIPFSLQ